MYEQTPTQFAHQLHVLAMYCDRYRSSWGVRLQISKHYELYDGNKNRV